MKKIKILSLFLMIVIVFAGCKKDDHTGYSTLVPVSGVTLTITPDFTSPITLTESDSTFTYTITLNKAQLVDLKLNIAVVASTATAGEDFDYLSSIVIPAGSTTAEGWIKISEDIDIEGDETFSITVGDATFANAEFTPVTYDFTVHNLTGDDLQIEFSWMPEAYDQHGDKIDYTTIADMVFSIEKPDGSVGVVDGAGFESYVILGDDDDGIYKLYAAFYSAMEFEEPVNMNFGLDYNQLGVFATSQSFPELANTSMATCPLNFYMAEVEKVGTTYTLTENAFVEDPYVLDLNDFAGTVTGIDDLDDVWYGPASQEYISVVNGTNLTISGFFYTKLLEWGTMTGGGTCEVTLNADHTVSVPQQFYASNDEGDPNGDWRYYMDGEGTWDHCGDTYWMDILYDPMYEDPSDPGNIYSMYDGGTIPVHFDHAYIEFSPTKGISIKITKAPVHLSKEKGKVK